MTFDNVFQGGASVDVFGASGSNPLDKWKVSGVGVQKVYDKSVRGYVLRCDGDRPSIRMPKDERRSLGLVQPFLVLQVLLSDDRSFSFELHVSDKGKTRRRILFSTSFREPASTPLHTRIPLAAVARGVWLNLVFDLVDLVSCNFGGAGFGRLDGICIGSACTLRRICTLRDPPGDAPCAPDGHSGLAVGASAPRGFELPSGVPTADRRCCLEAEYVHLHPD